MFFLAIGYQVVQMFPVWINKVNYILGQEFVFLGEFKPFPPV
jgi:hypothetical protein